MTPDLLIIGAGPAGVSAATEARAHGLSVLILDENATPGGRIWQALEFRAAPRTPTTPRACSPCTSSARAAPMHDGAPASGR